MAGKATGVNVPIDADVTGFTQGADKVSQSLDGISQDLKGVSTDAGVAADDVSSNFSEHIQHGLAHEGKHAIKQAGKDVAANLTGAVQSGVEGGGADIANTFAGIVATLSSIPVVGAVAVGAGLVLSVISGMNKHKSEAIAAAKKFGSSVSDAIADGVIDSADKQNIAEQALGVKDWASAADKISKNARALGVSADTYTQALSGNAEAQRQVAVASDALNKKIADQTDTTNTSFGQVVHLTDAQKAQKTATDETTTAIGKSNDAFAVAAQQQSETESALNGNADAATDTANALDKARVAAGKLARQKPIDIKVTATVSEFYVPPAVITGIRNKIQAGIKSGRYNIS